MTIYKSFVQFILFLPLISPSLDWQLYYACTIEITRLITFYPFLINCGEEGGKKEIRFLRKRRGMGMGTETIEVRMRGAPNLALAKFTEIARVNGGRRMHILPKETGYS